MPFSGYDDLNPAFAGSLQAFINASGGRIYITSGFRSVERQQQLWEQALRKYGDPEVADNWVARPGTSNHNHRIAADLGFADARARQWAHDNAGRFGLHFPMGWEPWHIEPLGSHRHSDRGAYTTAQGGFMNPRDAADAGLDPQGNVEDPFDPSVQAKRLFEIIEAGPDAMEGQMASPEMGVEAPSLEEEQAAAGESGEPEAHAAALARLAMEE